MQRRVLVTRAGTGAGNNLIRSLRAGGPPLLIVGCHDDRFVLKKSQADRNYLIPSATDADFRDALCRVIKAEGVDLLVPTTDVDVRVTSALSVGIPCRLFLPSEGVVELCQDKYELAVFLKARDVPTPTTYPVVELNGIDELFRRLAPSSRLWCRARAGTGSKAALPVESAEQARAWIRYWQEMRGLPATSFTLSDYLPGRDFACQSLWKDGQLVLIKTSERLAYFGGSGRPSGVSSVGAIHKTVFEPRVAEVSTAAIRALDARVSGAFSVDLKEDASGVPCVTEINVGRFLSGTTIFDLTGKHNMVLTYVGLALGEWGQIDEPYDVAPDYYMVRDLDTLPAIFHADELFEGVADARSHVAGRAG
jgi:carbamoyl-phosphate synthase large subunit